MSKQLKAGLPTISLEELAKHDKPQDLWTSVDGLVYDVTNWAPRHPGGFKKIMRGAGKDSTEMFRKFPLIINLVKIDKSHSKCLNLETSVIQHTIIGRLCNKDEKQTWTKFRKES